MGSISHRYLPGSSTPNLCAPTPHVLSLHYFLQLHPVGNSDSGLHISPPSPLRCPPSLLSREAFGIFFRLGLAANRGYIDTRTLDRFCVNKKNNPGAWARGIDHNSCDYVETHLELTEANVVPRTRYAPKGIPVVYFALSPNHITIPNAIIITQLHAAANQPPSRTHLVSQLLCAPRVANGSHPN